MCARCDEYARREAEGLCSECVGDTPLTDSDRSLARTVLTPYLESAWAKYSPDEPPLGEFGFPDLCGACLMSMPDDLYEEGADGAVRSLYFGVPYSEAFAEGGQEWEDGDVVFQFTRMA